MDLEAPLQKPEMKTKYIGQQDYTCIKDKKTNKNEQKQGQNTGNVS